MNRFSLRPLLLIGLLIVLTVSAVHGASRNSFNWDEDPSIKLDENPELGSLNNDDGLLSGKKVHQEAFKRSPLIRVARQTTCIERGSNCDHNVHGCCSGSSCRCNLWGANCRCARPGLV